MKAGPYSWIGTLMEASTTAAADLLEAEPIETAKGRTQTLDAITPIFDALPEVNKAQSEDLAAGVVAAIRVIRKWST
jgi:hypothetical protein